MNVKKLKEEAKLPTRNFPTDAGLDLCSPEYYMIHPGERMKIPLGLAFDIPQNHSLLMFPRSGLSLKIGTIILANVIDASYTGEVHCVAINGGSEPWIISKGDKIVQVILVPVNVEECQWVDDIIEKERGNKGFGSSGK